MLTPRQIASYRDAGYLTLEDVLLPEELDAARRAVDEIIDAAQGRTESDDRVDVVLGTGGERVTVVRRIFNPPEVDPRFEAIAQGPRVLDIMECLLGPNIEYHHGKVNMKPPGHDTEVGWHQDLPFFPHTNSDLAAIMLYLDDATEENGCLSVVPGSHRLGPLDHFAGGHFIGMVTEDLARAGVGRAVKLPVRAGGATIHHCLTLHSSSPNRGSRPRRALIYEYRAADALAILPDDEKNARHYGRLLRGERTGTVRLEAVVFKIPRWAPDLDPRSLYDMQEDYKRKAGASPAR
jgi:ectoine hydroxylase-related dioxygenase (phytanoyl-CoA dioxygenase family)